MQCGTQTWQPAARPGHGSFWLADAARRLWQRYWLRRSRRATVFMLRSLDEHALHDIGIDRSEIESLVYGDPAERRQCFARMRH